MSLEVLGRDRHGRRIARVRVDGHDLGSELLRSGWAWHFRQYDHDTSLARLEADARRARRGLWADKQPIPPWEWRRRSRR